LACQIRTIKMTEIDRKNLEELAKKYPNTAIRFDNEFLGGTDKKEFGFVPNNWNGNINYFTYSKYEKK
jgi:hypothetical protein